MFPESLKQACLKDRAHMLSQARAFFAKRGVLEVDPGALVKCPPNDSHIDIMAVEEEGAFLHSSPEYAMKRLLATGLGDIYYLGHVFRKKELGKLHNPEFTLVEWYRQIPFAEMIRETCEFLFLFLDPLPIQTISYRDAFEGWLGINYTEISLKSLQQMTQSSWPRSTCLDYLFTHKIEPKLGQNALTILTDYPSDQAALACTVLKNGECVAERYEIYCAGVELCNGYHELRDEKELRRRFHEKNSQREAEGKAPYALDEKFLASLSAMPDCCGVALGFDRALMLRHRLRSIQPILPFAWDEL